MALEQKLSIRMAQKLVMTPSLQQAIKLLQMTRMELEGVLTQEMVENPLLEDVTEVMEKDKEKEKEQEKAEEELATDEPTDDPLDKIDLEDYFGDYMQGSSYASTRESRDDAPFENTLTQEPDLYDHLLFQLHMLDVSPLRRHIAELIIGNLTPDGFLAATEDEIARMLAEELLVLSSEGVGSEVEGAAPPSEKEIAAGNGSLLAVYTEAATSDAAEDLLAEADRLEEAFTAPGGGATAEAGEAEDLPVELEADVSQLDLELLREVESAMALVRSFDPAGVARRDLRESLIAQLEAKGVEEDALSRRMLEDHWDLFLRRQFPQIAKILGIDLAELEPAVDQIRALEIRPGRRFGGDRTHYIEPDVQVRKVGDEYVIQLNDDGLPRLRVSRAYRRMYQKMRAEGKQDEAQQFIKEKMRSAVWLIKSLDQRQRTIYKVANSIVKQQRGFLEHGIEQLKPMVLRDVAEDIGMHESTVSRVVSNKYIHTPRGLHPMKFFFHSGIDRRDGDNISSLTVKRKLEQIIESENPKKPYSDSSIMKILKREGIQIARRTVAKYREELGIPSSTDRKQIF